MRQEGPSKSLFPHASCFCDVQLSRNQILLLSALDLPDFYHTVEVSRQRALWQQLGRPKNVDAVQDLAAYQRLVEREGGPPPPGVQICLLQATLPMGSARAADVADKPNNLRGAPRQVGDAVSHAGMTTQLNNWPQKQKKDPLL